VRYGKRRKKSLGHKHIVELAEFMAGLGEPGLTLRVEFVLQPDLLDTRLVLSRQHCMPGRYQ